jgi:hypothetical protein
VLYDYLRTFYTNVIPGFVLLRFAHAVFVWIDPNAPVSNLLASVATLAQVAANDVQLVFKNSPLSDVKRTPRQFGIVNDSVLYLCLRRGKQKTSDFRQTVFFLVSVFVIAHEP